MGIVFTTLSLFILSGLYSIKVNPGLNKLYNRVGPKIAPNQVAVVLFDFRGFDTLGECIILVSGVLAVSLVFGRGLLSKERIKERTGVGEYSTPILDYVAPIVVFLIFSLGVYVTLGGHITPGGGFQGGSMIAAGILLSVVVLGGRNLAVLDHRFLVKLESVGVLLYILLGVAGMVLGGFFLYNLGVDEYGIIPKSASVLFNYPDVVGAGIIPYLNIAVLLKVGAGLSTIILVLLEVHLLLLIY